MSEQEKPAEVAAEAPAAEVPAEKSKLADVREKAEAANKGLVANERGAIKASAAAAAEAVAVKALESRGIQETLEFIRFGVGIEKAIAGAKADGKVDFADLGQLFPLAPLAVAAVDGIGNIPKELGDLEDAELEVLIAEAGAIVGSDNRAKTIEKIRAALKFAHAGYDLYKAFAKK